MEGRGKNLKKNIWEFAQNGGWFLMLKINSKLNKFIIF
jgi:hypothetical protein